MKIVAVILSLLCTVAGLESSERETRPGRLSGTHIDVTQLEKKIHNMINKERRKKGLPVLSWDESLHSIARKYSQDMVQRNFFSHNDPDGRTFLDRYKAAGFKCRIQTGNTICLGAENISQETFYNSDTEDKIAESVVQRWMNSKGHRNNILTPYFKKQGIGVALSEDGIVYVTESFC